MAGREAAGDALIQIGIKGGVDGMWGIRVSPGGDMEGGGSADWARWAGLACELGRLVQGGFPRSLFVFFVFL